jgi:hypothetical protein
MIDHFFAAQGIDDRLLMIDYFSVISVGSVALALMRDD